MKRRIRAFVILIECIILFVVPVSAASGSIHVMTQGEAILYRVGVSEGSGYRLDEICGGGYLTFDDTMSGDLAQWLTRRMENEKEIEPVTYNTFCNLQEGLYLISCKNGSDFSPFLVSVPWDGYYWEVDVDPTGGATPQTGDAVGIALLGMATSGAGLMVIGRRKKCY